MLLTIDIGNTNICFALCDGAQIIRQWRMATDRHKTKDEYAVWLLNVLQHSGIDIGVIKTAIICSVVPDVNFAIKQLVREYLHIEPHMVVDGNIDCGIKVKIDQPEELGADRLINASAAWSLYHQACIIVDFGTATTFDALSNKGEYVGGAIAPGINLSLEALKQAASKLHGVAITRPKQVIGKNTSDAMISGVYYGYTGLIEGIVSRMSDALGGDVKVIATGGLSALYAQATSMIHVVDENLTITGLRLLHAQLTKPASKKDSKKA
jgi:type III pantothenate kinase